MAKAVSSPLILFPDDHDAQSEHEAASRGYLSHVVVQTDEGVRYQLCFYDPVRLGQTLADEFRLRANGFGEPNMVVVPDVTSECIRKAVEELWRAGYFNEIKPLR